MASANTVVIAWGFFKRQIADGKISLPVQPMPNYPRTLTRSVTDVYMGEDTEILPDLLQPGQGCDLRRP